MRRARGRRQVRAPPPAPRRAAPGHSCAIRRRARRCGRDRLRSARPATDCPRRSRGSPRRWSVGSGPSPPLTPSGGRRYAPARPPGRAAAARSAASARQSGRPAAIPRTAPGSSFSPARSTSTAKRSAEIGSAIASSTPRPARSAWRGNSSAGRLWRWRRIGRRWATRREPARAPRPAGRDRSRSRSPSPRA